MLLRTLVPSPVQDPGWGVRRWYFGHVVRAGRRGMTIFGLDMPRLELSRYTIRLHLRRLSRLADPYLLLSLGAKNLGDGAVANCALQVEQRIGCAQVSLIRSGFAT